MTSHELLPSHLEQQLPLDSAPLRQGDAWRHSFAPLIAGICSGGAATVVGHPFETLKTRMQVGRLLPENTPLNGALVRQLYRGLLPPLFTTGSINSFHFTLFESFRRKFEPEGAVHGHKYDLSTTFLAGCVSGSMISWINCPVQVVKIHQQVASEQGIITCIQQIYRDAGFRGFYRGFTTALPLDASRGMYLTAYELLKVQLAKLGHTCSSFVGSALEVPLPGRASLQMDAPSHGKATPAPMTSYVNPHAVESSASAAVASDSWNPESMSIRMAAAGLSGICCWLIIYPVDVVKSRLQSDYRGLKYSGASDCILQAYREGGIRVFYRGLVMNVIRAGPVSAATLSTYELVKDILLKKDASGNYTASFVTACAKSTDRV